MDNISRERMHAAEIAGRAADAAIAAARAPVDVPMSKEERAEFLSHSEEMLPSKKFANEETPMVGALPGGTVRSLSSAPMPGVDPGSVLAQITSPFGTPRGSFEDVKPTDHIKIGNMSTSVAVALKMRAIEFNSRTGEITVPAPPSAEALAAKTATDAAQAEANAPVEGVVSPALQKVLENLGEMSRSPEVGNANLISVLVKTAEGGHEAGGKVLTQRLGIAPEVATENVRAAVENGTASVVARLNSMGLPGQATIEKISSSLNVGDRVSLGLGLIQGRKESWTRIIAEAEKVKRAQSIGK